jgi:hypothetical protein
MIAPSCSRFMIGMTSISGSLDMMTPAACTPHCRLRPSSPLAVSTTSHVGVGLVELRNSPGLAVALVLGSKIPDSGMSLPMTAAGIALVSRSPMAKG